MTVADSLALAGAELPLEIFGALKNKFKSPYFLSVLEKPNMRGIRDLDVELVLPDHSRDCTEVVATLERLPNLERLAIGISYSEFGQKHLMNFALVLPHVTHLDGSLSDLCGLLAPQLHTVIACVGLAGLCHALLQCPRVHTFDGAVQYWKSTLR